MFLCRLGILLRWCTHSNLSLFVSPLVAPCLYSNVWLSMERLIPVGFFDNFQVIFVWIELFSYDYENFKSVQSGLVRSLCSTLLFCVGGSAYIRPNAPPLFRQGLDCISYSAPLFNPSR